MCGRSAAKFFCACTAPETLLCENCLGKHMSQDLMLVHQTRQIELLRIYKNPQGMERMAALRKVREEAMQSIQEVDRAITEFSTKVQELIVALTVLRATKVEELQGVKATLAREVPCGLEEVERTLAEERPLLTTQFGPVFRERIDKPAPLSLFAYTMETCSSLALLRFHLANSQEISRFAGVYEDKVFLYEVESQRITQHTLSLNFGMGGSYVEVDRDTLLCEPCIPPQLTLGVASVAFVANEELCVLSAKKQMLHREEIPPLSHWRSAVEQPAAS